MAPVRLSQNFTSDEFKCPCCSVFHIDMRLINALEELRTKLKKPLKILSGYRCAKHNAEVGGAQASEHTTGLAADVALPKGVSLKDFYSAADGIAAFSNGGIGAYPSERFLHLDVRSKRARWSRIDGKYVAIEQAFKK